MAQTSTSPKSLWRNADFLKLWAGQTISLIGSEVTGLALPLTAALTLNATPAQMGILGAVQYAPALLLGLFAGVWIDRVRRRPILLFADVGRALLLASIPVAILLGAHTINYLYGVAFTVGALTVLFSVAYQAYLPSLVEKAHLVEANGRFEASRALAGILGVGPLRRARAASDRAHRHPGRRLLLPRLRLHPRHHPHAGAKARP